MDRILLIVLMFLLAGMAIAITRKPTDIVMFYAMLGGAISVILYSAMKDKKTRRDINKKRKSK